MQDKGLDVYAGKNIIGNRECDIWNGIKAAALYVATKQRKRHDVEKIIERLEIVAIVAISLYFAAHVAVATLI